jgi:hypothetical protein
LLEKFIGKDIQVEAPRNSDFIDTRKFTGTVVYEPKQESFILQNKVQSCYVYTMYLCHGKQKDNVVHFIKTTEPISYHLLSPAPDTLFHEPTVEMTLDAPSSLGEIAYSVTNAFQWEVVYNAVLNPKETELEFTGWFQILNKSGKTYKDATLIVLTDPEAKARKEEEARKKKKEEEKSDSPLPAIPKIGFGALGNKLRLCAKC